MSAVCTGGGDPRAGALQQPRDHAGAARSLSGSLNRRRSRLYPQIEVVSEALSEMDPLYVLRRMKMRKRIVSLLLAAVMLLGLSSVAAAAQPEGEARLVRFAAASPTSMAVEPERISYTQGQTIRQALASSSHTFDGIETGYIRAIDGVSGTFMIYDDVGEYDLDRPAASIQSIAFLGVELSTAQARTLSAMCCWRWRTTICLKRRAELSGGPKRL